MKGSTKSLLLRAYTKLNPEELRERQVFLRLVTGSESPAKIIQSICYLSYPVTPCDYAISHGNMHSDEEQGTDMERIQLAGPAILSRRASKKTRRGFLWEQYPGPDIPLLGTTNQSELTEEALIPGGLAIRSYRSPRSCKATDSSRCSFAAAEKQTGLFDDAQAGIYSPWACAVASCPISPGQHIDAEAPREEHYHTQPYLWNFAHFRHTLDLEGYTVGDPRGGPIYVSNPQGIRSGESSLGVTGRLVAGLMQVIPLGASWQASLLVMFVYITIMGRGRPCRCAFYVRGTLNPSPSLM
ncbi:hypothetical protein PG991_012924 [Apiospora marii]|uniref:Uncharacterized protein n=1 Tax=Apiospora marii TaxID=335849 RepID=A0ABR1RBJ4_9PEZI